jgi:hypothetical protein
MQKIAYYIAAFLAFSMFVACGGPSAGNKSGGQPEADTSAAEDTPVPATNHTAIHPFPSVSVPSVYAGNNDAALDYMLEHYWDAFLKSGGATTPETILGVKDEDVEQALADYIQMLSELKGMATPDDTAPLRKAQKGVKNFFGKMEALQKRDTTSHTYLRLTEMVSHYLYDPNSPMRDEDLYLPFVEAAAESPCTRDDMRNAYRHELKMCRTNTFGNKVPDIRFKDINGHMGRLYNIDAEYTMLFFSNPGCSSCKEIINDVMSRGYIESLISRKKLAVVNIYIDEEVSKWRDYSHNYPSCWINGYDYTFSLRESGAYDIRAIPSLYLLDSDKRVLMKDAPTSKVLSFLDKII